MATKATRTAKVKGYPRLAYNVWRLIARSVLATFPEERPRGRTNGATAIIDENVMCGLRVMAEITNGASLILTDDERKPIEAARAWLECGNAEAP